MIFVHHISRALDMKEKTRVTLTTNDGGKSIHIFEKQTEASNFIDWIQNYNTDLEIEVRQQKINNGLLEALSELTKFEWKIMGNKENLIYTGLHDLKVEYIDISDFTYNIWEFKREDDIGGLAGGYIDQAGPLIIMVNGIGEIQILHKYYIFSY